MNLDFATLEALRKNHPGWKLLLADSAPLVVSFLRKTFIEPNIRVLSQVDLIEALEDELYGLRERFGAGAFPRRAQEYLNEWASNDRAWLRKFYPQNSDEPHFDLTPTTEKTIAWVDNLTARAFVGTESRLLTLFELLRQMVQGSETDPHVRIAELQKRRDEIDAEIARVQQGDLSLLDDTGLKDRFQQFVALARELLSDFREVEHNFRNLDRQVRERITLWEGAKGALLDEILGQRDAIADSDQGRSFRAFWDFLMSQSRQEELSGLLEQVLRLPAVAKTTPDKRLNRVHYDWLDAGEHTQRTVAQLSQQLRRFMDDQAYLENRRIMNILRSIEIQAVAVRDTHPRGEFMSVAEPGTAIDLPMERPLYSPSIKPLIASQLTAAGDADIDVEVLFSQVVVDKAKLAGYVRQALQSQNQITLRALVESHPLEHGLAELVTYLQLAVDSLNALFDEERIEPVTWQDQQGNWKSAEMPRVIFVR
ncbi:MAG TPA: DUF3375 domain-containing protein [Terriglobia bacterium]|nr:DUF3375 domain-containing protein [Terriglobia bacterium]